MIGNPREVSNFNWLFLEVNWFICSPDMMLLAARALTHLCDVLPSSCASVVHYGAVPCFCAHLLTI